MLVCTNSLFLPRAALGQHNMQSSKMPDFALDTGSAVWGQGMTRTPWVTAA